MVLKLNYDDCVYVKGDVSVTLLVLSAKVLLKISKVMSDCLLVSGSRGSLLKVLITLTVVINALFMGHTSRALGNLTRDLASTSRLTRTYGALLPVVLDLFTLL